MYSADDRPRQDGGDFVLDDLLVVLRTNHATDVVVDTCKLVHHTSECLRAQDAMYNAILVSVALNTKKAVESRGPCQVESFKLTLGSSLNLNMIREKCKRA